MLKKHMNWRGGGTANTELMYEYRLEYFKRAIIYVTAVYFIASIVWVILKDKQPN